MSWEDIIKVSRYEKDLADEFAPKEMEEFRREQGSDFARKVSEKFKSQLEERGEMKITDAKAKKIMQSYEELLNLTDDRRKEIAIREALGSAPKNHFRPERANAIMSSLNDWAAKKKSR